MKLLFIFSIYLTACTLTGLDTKKTGLHKSSQSIEESKRNKVFHHRLQVDNPIINIGDNKTDTIKQIWVEDMWQYVDDGTIKIKKDSTQQTLIRLAVLSRKNNGKIFLQHGNDSYFGWNGVLFDTYKEDTDTIFI
jgi:hypothetical protein